jgi:MoxR-like ATPase
MRVEKFETKSSSVAKDLFYSFDTIRRFQVAHSGGSAKNLDYLSYNALGRAILNALPRREVDAVIPKDFPHNGPARSVVLIDEIDKAPRDFPNDLLNEIEYMYFKIPELDNMVVGGPETLPDELKPIVIITSNSERNLPDPFLRRCIYYDIPFPNDAELRDILLSRLQRLISRDDRLVKEALDFFLKLRAENIPRRKISPAELIQWLMFMLERGASLQARLRDSSEMAFEGLGALTKDPADQQRVRDELKAFLGMG